MVSLDFIVELPPSEGNTVILVVVDRLTKMSHFVPIKNTPSASETAKIFIKEVVRLHGIPADIVSDRGVQFTSRFWRTLCTTLEINLSLSSAYHPQTNGQTERTNQTLEQYLRCFSSFSQHDWATLLPLAEFSYNNAVHSSTKQSPFFANYGFHPTFLPDVIAESTVPASRDMTVFLEENSKILKETMTKAQEDSKKFYDQKRRGDLFLQPGDLVWLSTTNLKLACPSKKLGPKYLGPFAIRRKVNDVAYELSLPESLKIHPVFHVALLKPANPDPFPNRRTRPPEPVLVNNEEEYEVEAIMDCRRWGGQLQYLVKWKGYGPEDNSWEPEHHIHTHELIDVFKTNHPEKAKAVIRRLSVGRGQCKGNPAHHNNGRSGHTV